MATDQVTAARTLKDPTHSAYLLLRVVFTVAPVVFGLDKFFNLLTHPHHWSMYLAPGSTTSCPAAPISACIWWA